jgi:hypothetical protein
LLQYLFCYLHSVTLWEGSQALHENQIDGVGFSFLIHIFFCLLFIRLRFFHHKWCIRVYFFLIIVYHFSCVFMIDGFSAHVMGLGLRARERD